MTITQKIYQTIYPALRAAGRLLGFKAKMKTNTGEIMPDRLPWELSAFTNQGKKVDFGSMKGRYLLIANTASQCGYTAQYAELQRLQDQYADRLTVLAFPANDFGGQEPGSNDEIAHFCAVNFGVSFPVMMKTDVVGKTKNPVFQWLTDPAQNGWNSQEPTWNFCKYLVSPDGQLLGFFESGVSPLDAEITGRIV